MGKRNKKTKKTYRHTAAVQGGTGRQLASRPRRRSGQPVSDFREPQPRPHVGAHALALAAWAPERWRDFLATVNSRADAAGWDEHHRVFELTVTAALCDEMEGARGIRELTLEGAQEVVITLRLVMEMDGVAKEPLFALPVSEAAVALILQCHVDEGEGRLLVAVTRWGGTHCLLAQRTGNHSSQPLDQDPTAQLRSQTPGLEAAMRRLLDEATG